MGILLRVLVAAGLVVDAVVHWMFAPDMKFVQGGMFSGDWVFYGQAALAAAAAVLVLGMPRRWTYAVAFLVAASALGAVVLYTYVDVGVLGPLPNMHDPVWYSEKVISAVGEGVAALAALVGFLTVRKAAPERERERQPA